MCAPNTKQKVELNRMDTKHKDKLRVLKTSYRRPLLGQKDLNLIKPVFTYREKEQVSVKLLL